MTVSWYIAANGTRDDELTSSASVEITERLGEQAEFILTFQLESVDDEFALLSDRRIAPGAEPAVFVTFNDTVSCLLKGIVLSQNITLSHGGNGSLEVEGGDSSVKMDREDKTVVRSDVSASDAVEEILSSYGYQTDVESTGTTFSEDSHSLAQHTTDLKFIKKLADRNGFLFRITADENGNETARFKPVEVDSSPAAILKINQEPPSIRELEIEWDIDRPAYIGGIQLDLQDKSEIEVSEQSSPTTAMASTPLTDVSESTRKGRLVPPLDSAGELEGRMNGVFSDSGWFVKAFCETTAELVDTVLRPGDIVETQGAGSVHSGRYLVAAVTHKISSTSFVMELELIRNAINR